MFNVVDFSHPPGIAPPPHLLVVGIDNSVAPHNSKRNSFLQTGKTVSSTRFSYTVDSMQHTYPEFLVSCGLLLLVANGVWELVNLDVIFLNFIQDLRGKEEVQVRG